MATRDELLRLVSTLPDEALPVVHDMLTRMQTWPPPVPAAVDSAAVDFERRMEERMESLRRDHPFAGGGGFGSLTYEDGPSGGVRRRRGRQSVGYEEHGQSVHVSDIAYDDCDFRLTERIRREAVSDTVSFTLELTGPDGTTTRHEHRYGEPAQ